MQQKTLKELRSEAGRAMAAVRWAQATPEQRSEQIVEPVTSSRNNAGRRKRSGETTSRYKGVHWSASHGCWCARLSHKGHRYELGYFDDEVEAAKAYDEARLRLSGEFARLNFPI